MLEKPFKIVSIDKSTYKLSLIIQNLPLSENVFKSNFGFLKSDFEFLNSVSVMLKTDTEILNSDSEIS